MLMFNKVILWRLSPQQRKLFEELIMAVAVCEVQEKAYQEERGPCRGDCSIDNQCDAGATDKLPDAIYVQEEKIQALVAQCRRAKIPEWRISLIV